MREGRCLYYYTVTLSMQRGRSHYLRGILSGKINWNLLRSIIIRWDVYEYYYYVDNNASWLKMLLVSEQQKEILLIWQILFYLFIYLHIFWITKLKKRKLQYYLGRFDYYTHLFYCSVMSILRCVIRNHWVRCSLWKCFDTLRFFIKMAITWEFTIPDNMLQDKPTLHTVYTQ